MTHIFLFTLMCVFKIQLLKNQRTFTRMSKQNVALDNDKKEKKKETAEDLVQEKLENQAIQKMNKANENLILMTQNYNKYYYENTCECSTISLPSRILSNAKTNWMSSEKLNDLRRKAHEAVRMHKVFILKGFFHTVRKALIDRGWVMYKNMNILTNLYFYEKKK